MFAPLPYLLALLTLTACAACDSQQRAEDAMRGGRSFCEVHREVPACAEAAQ